MIVANLTHSLDHKYVFALHILGLKVIVSNLTHSLDRKSFMGLLVTKTHVIVANLTHRLDQLRAPSSISKI